MQKGLINLIFQPKVYNKIPIIFQNIFTKYQQVYLKIITFKYQRAFRRGYNAQHCLITLI